jgi:hypothetical protein
MIDFIITWVDGDDLKWQEKLAKYKIANKNDSGVSSRFRDMGTLRYIFRGIENFSPWVNKVHFVTDRQIPEWLNIKHPKLNILSHEDIFLDKNHLPVFNSNAIEMNFLGIKNLSEQFVLFNDDMLILKKVEKEVFFIEGLPVDFLIQDGLRNFLRTVIFPQITFGHTIKNAIKIINTNFNKNKIVSKNKDKYINIEYGFYNNLKNMFFIFFPKFIGFKDYHNPQPYLKSTWFEVFNKHKKEIMETSSRKFRSSDDIIHYLFRYWHLVKGDFIPKLKEDSLVLNIGSLKDAILSVDKMKDYTFVCINDSSTLSQSDFLESQKVILENLNDIMPVKSNFEI